MSSLVEDPAGVGNRAASAALEAMDAGKQSSAASRLKGTFRALDAFPKVEDEYLTRSVSGAIGKTS